MRIAETEDPSCTDSFACFFFLSISLFSVFKNLALCGAAMRFCSARNGSFLIRRRQADSRRRTFLASASSMHASAEKIHSLGVGSNFAAVATRIATERVPALPMFVLVVILSYGSRHLRMLWLRWPIIKSLIQQRTVRNNDLVNLPRFYIVHNRWRIVSLQSMMSDDDGLVGGGFRIILALRFVVRDFDLGGWEMTTFAQDANSPILRSDQHPPEEE